MADQMTRDTASTAHPPGPPHPTVASAEEAALTGASKLIGSMPLLITAVNLL